MFYAVLFVHWLADFVCQTRMMANNKSSSMRWLLTHVGAYTAIMCVFGFRFALINGIAHLITDFFSSRLTSRFYKAGKIHEFFCVIGFDQLLHTAVLYGTLSYATLDYIKLF